MQDQRPRGPRLYHKKSRTGCLRCKQRRVKCDESRPSCSSCSRHAVECFYPNANQVSARPAQTVRHNSGPPSYSPNEQTVSSPAALADDGSQRASISSLCSQNESKSNFAPQNLNFYPSPGSPLPPSLDEAPDADVGLPEGPWRRYWEIRLIHNYHQNMVQPFPMAQNPEILHMWKHDIPNLTMRMAQEHNRCSLLNVSLANSALYLWTKSTDKKERDELFKLQQTYQIMCTREQRRDVDELSHMISKNVDYICFTSIRILAHSLALVQTLAIDPWEPPVQWLHMGRGAGQVLDMARGLLDTDSELRIKLFSKSKPDMSNPMELIYCDHSRLDWLLEHPAGPKSIAAQEDRELDDEDVKAVYSKALSYICSVQTAIDVGEPDYAIVRRFGGFAVWVPIEFSKFIEERRPRAMVVLAHFMALWVRYEHIWMVGKAGEMQIRGIYKIMPSEWKPKLDSLFLIINQAEAAITDKEA
ncbi:hypothetical protein F4805DRAFT_470482 [Annulohypoxylon moriforme]|nr:hypothetical protein F4805DRAFT_470482 [Annulohypoxylon moriforme]